MNEKRPCADGRVEATQRTHRRRTANSSAVWCAAVTSSRPSCPSLAVEHCTKHVSQQYELATRARPGIQLVPPCACTRRPHEKWGTTAKTTVILDELLIQGIVLGDCRKAGRDQLTTFRGTLTKDVGSGTARRQRMLERSGTAAAAAADAGDRTAAAAAGTTSSANPRGRAASSRSLSLEHGRKRGGYRACG